MSYEHEAWKQTRKKGKWSYVLWNGMVFWGLPMFVIQIFVITRPPTPSSWFYSETSKYPVSWIAFMLASGCLFGLLYGLFTWWANERSFQSTFSVLPQDTELEPEAISVTVDNIAIAVKKIRNSWVAGLVLVSVTLVFILINLNGVDTPGVNAWTLGDLVIILALNYGVYRKSRFCAVLLLAYYVTGKILIFYDVGSLNGLPLALVFTYFFTQGVVGTFRYHKLIHKTAGFGLPPGEDEVIEGEN